MSEIPWHITDWAAQRERHRQQHDYAAADALRERIEAAGFLVTDTARGPVVTRAQRYTTVQADVLPDRRAEPDGPDASILLLLDACGLEPQPEWVVDDAARCLASILEHGQGHRYEVLILDNGVGGAAGDWAADAAGGPGIAAVHLAEPVGFARARALQHRLATGRVLLWLDTGVELTGDVLGPLLAVFADPSVGAAGRWGGDIGAGLESFVAAEPGPGADRPPRDVHAVWGYLLALRRALVTSGAVEPDPGYRFYRNADADVSLQVRAAGARTVLVDLPAVQRVHRGYAETPAEVVERESRRNYRRLLARWREVMESLAAR